MGISDPDAAERHDNRRSGTEPEMPVRRDRRFIGSMIMRRRDETRRAHPWELGASSERIVGAYLDRIAGIDLLHDRCIPGTRANIDHIAIGPGGVYVIDAKLCRRLEPRIAGRSGGRDARSTIGDRDQSKLIAKLRTQVTAITRALGATPIPVSPALCFVPAPRATVPEPFMLDGVWVGAPAALPDLVTRPGLLDPEAMRAAARLLDARLPRA